MTTIKQWNGSSWQTIVVGKQGPQGYQGSVGAQGYQGSVGTQGFQGYQGSVGTQGSTGTAGTNGTAATVSVGSTATGAAGTSASVTNSGTSSAAIFNFTIPQGSQGLQGYQGSVGAQGYQGSVGAQGPGGTNSYYGSFYDTSATQTVASVSASTQVIVGSTALGNGVSLGTGGSVNQVVISSPGTYAVELSIQFQNVDTSQVNNAYAWFRQNGLTIAASNSTISIPAKHTGINGYGLLTVPFMITTTATNEVLDFFWTADSTQVSIVTVTGPSGSPVAPGVIATVQLAGYQGTQGYQGYQGYQGSVGAQGFQGYQGSVGTQGFQGYQGYQGSVGAQGFQGYQGSVGAQGYQGSVGTQGSTGSFNANSAFQGPLEVVSIDSSTQLSGSNTATVSVKTAGVYYFSNASGPTATYTINVRGDGSTTLNSLLSTGQAVTVAVIVQNGSTGGASGFYATTIQVDGTTQTVKWTNGLTPASATLGGIDSYTLTIIKTASATFTVLGSVSKFA